MYLKQFFVSRNSLKKGTFFVFFLAVFLSVPAIAKRCTQGFRLAKLQITEPFCKEWEAPHPENIIPLLQQKYYFLGRGAQSYVFQSHDGLYVLKLFRSDHGSVKPLFQACLLAFSSARKETGLVYLHLNKTDNILPLLTIFDAIGRKWQLPLDKYRFAIQKRGKDFQETLRMAKGQMEEKIDQFLLLLINRSEKNIVNTDPNLLRNFGFLEESAIELDFGNYRYMPYQTAFIEIQKYAKKLRKWLQKEDPSSVLYLDTQLERIRCASL